MASPLDTPDYQGNNVPLNTYNTYSAFYKLTSLQVVTFLPAIAGKQYLIYDFTCLQRDNTGAKIAIYSAAPPYILEYLATNLGVITQRMGGLGMGVGNGLLMANLVATAQTQFDSINFLYQIQ